jgi:metallo-beta-lactamase class B
MQESDMNEPALQPGSTATPFSTFISSLTSGDLQHIIGKGKERRARSVTVEGGSTWARVSRTAATAAVLLVTAFPISAFAADLALWHLRGHLYVVEDEFYAKENSMVYVGEKSVTVIGATWTPDTAKELVTEIRKITSAPITQVIDTNYHPDRAGGNAYFKAIGTEIVSTEMTREQMARGWDEVVQFTRSSIPNYPALPLVLPDKTYASDFTLQDGRIRSLYLGPSHTRDGIFVFFPEEKVLYGNCILKEKLGNLKYADLTEYPKTLLKLKAVNLGFETIVAGHYSAIHGPELIDQYLALLEAHGKDAR